MNSVDRSARVRDALLCMQRYSWEQGVCAQAAAARGETHLVVMLAHETLVRQLADGRLGVVGAESSVVDAAANGPAVLHAAALTGDSRYRLAAERMLAWLQKPENRNADGLLYHRLDAKQIWVDSLYMALPFLVQSDCIDDALAQLEGFRRLLWNPVTRLFSAVWDDEARTFVRPEPWGVGNGWALAALVAVAEALPKERIRERSLLWDQARDLIQACLVHQRADGLFHNVLDDPTTFVDTNVAQMVAFAIYRLALLDRGHAELVARADAIRRAVDEKVDDQGLVQGVCGAPRFDSSGTAAEGQAFYLLMDAAADEYQRSHQKKEER